MAHEDNEVIWVNGKPSRVVAQGVAHHGRTAWCVRIENEHGVALKCNDGSIEVSHPYPGNRGKTETMVKRIAAAHNVPAYTRDPRAGFIRLDTPKR